MSALGSALAEVDQAMAWSPAERDLERVETTKDHALLLTARSPSGPRWFRFAGDRLAELHPAQDERLPLCSQLADAPETQVVTWRPGRRICLRTRVDGEIRFLKGFRAKKGARAIDNHRRMAARPARPGQFVVPPILDPAPNDASLVLSAIDAPALTVHGSHAAAYFRVGHALRLFQGEVALDGLPDHGAEDELDLLEGLALRTASALGEEPPEWRRTFERAKQVPRPEASPVAAHRDLHPSQILRLPNRVALLDFDLLSRAHPLLDAANLTAHLRLRALQRLDGASGPDADDAANAFLEGYVGDAPDVDLCALRFYQATTFLRLALLYSVRPRWADLAPTLTRLAGRCLDA